MESTSGPSGPNGPSSGPTPLVTAFSDSIIKDFNKRVYKFPEESKLKGPDNFDQWKSALEIQFRALGIPGFIVDPTIASSLSDPDQAILLMLLKDSLTSGPQTAITWIRSPIEAYNLLVKQYSHSAEIQRGYLYTEFHSLSFKDYKGSLEEFNSSFNNLLARLSNSKVLIQPIDQTNQYLEALKTTFPY